MCVRSYVDIQLRMCSFIYQYTSTTICVCIRSYMAIRCVCARACMGVCVFVLSYVAIRTLIYVCLFIYRYTFTYAFVFVRADECMCVH